MQCNQGLFRKARLFYETGFATPLVLKRKSDFTPWEIYQKIYPQGGSSFFLDSLHYRPPAQRYSYLGCKPYLRVFFKEGKLWTEGESHRIKTHPNLVTELQKLFASPRVPPEPSFEYFTGGAVGYLGYELAQEFEKISFRTKKKLPFPTLALLFFRDVIVFDHKRGDYFLISWIIPKKRISFFEALKKVKERLQEMESIFETPPAPSVTFQMSHFRPEISRSNFKRMVRKAQSYIRAGDIYQANLSQRFSFQCKGSPLALYSRLRETNPSPYAAALHVGELFIASSSPELLIEKKGRQGITCPIAGTRPRGRAPEETRRFLQELSTSEKERAEHLMLVDLERNDLGRVSEWRSVRVKDFMRIEKYARVMHLVSEIVGQIHPSKDAWDLIQAMFPGGTITGCPKIRSMEIIDELEPVERGIYTGSIGYIGFDGNLKLNIAIRTLVLHKNRGYLQVGAGIVADSDPEREYEETLAKGEALAEALIQASA